MAPPPRPHAWARRKERGSPLLIRFITWLACRTGRAPTRLLLHPICLYFLIMAPRARRCSRDYLTRLHQRPARLREIYSHIHCFAATILDRVFFLTDRHGLFDLRFEGLDALAQARAKGQGVILLGAHFGSFDAMRALAASQGDMPLKILMYAGADSRVAQVIHSLNPVVAATIIPLGGTESMLEVREWLDGGGLIGILGDRITHGEKTVPVSFLGAQTALPTGPWMLAALTGAPVVMFAGIYEGGNRYRIRFQSLSGNERIPRAQRDAVLATRVEEYATVLEAWVKASPENWFNFYDYWS